MSALLKPHHKFVETFASFLLCYLSGMIDTTITNFGTPQAPAYAGVLNIFLLTLFIMAFAPGSGGHINPLITFSTMIVGLTGFSRAILYMSGQLLGAGLAGGVLRGAFGVDRSIEFKGGGCFRDSGTVAAEQALLIETISSFALLALAFGVALDPRQRELFGPLGGPIAITEILFDCDNTLVLSEELAFEACADLSNEILAKYDIPDRYTGPELLNDFVGQNFRGMVVNLQKKFDFTIPGPEMEKYVSMEEDRVIAKLERDAKPCVGCTEELDKLYKAKKYGMAVVSSSALRRVQASIDKVDQAKYFPKDHIFSAATSLPKPTTKPDPAIYLHACKVIGKEPGECVAVEDSKSGTLSAVRAGIPVIGYVGSYSGSEKQKEMTETLKGLGVGIVMQNWDEFPECLEAIEKM
ncbi:MAG: hypothetical protein ASARMPREDX12_006764 [Alectoria sarmentosa]|nr:MAG: hypothetical protein ASARMPREDX12_006764 [Alectoria sarmentosa]